MILGWPKFSGLAPKVEPRRLAPGMAQTARNTDMTSRTVKPWVTALTVLSGVAAAAQTTIYRYGQSLVSDAQYWFAWPVDVDVVKGAISGDQTERTYFLHPSLGARKTNNSLALTGGSGAYPWNSYPLGVPAPTGAPTAAITIDGATSTSRETRYYVFTYVTDWGEESAPSPVSNTLDVYPSGATVLVSGLGTTPPGGYSNITAKRVYRTLSGSSVTSFQLVDEIPISQDTYSDSTAGASLGEVIPSATWTAPPASPVAMTAMANGIMLLFEGYDVYASEAYIPYAYPIAYSQAVDFPIVGGCGFGTSAVVLTTGNPYLVTGSDPSALSMVKLESNQACVSKRSIAAVEGGVMYASPDGLMLVTQSGQVTNLTAGFYDHATWQLLAPTSMHGYAFDNRYYGFYDTGAVQGGFVYDPGQADAAFTLLDMYATAGYTDLLQDALYLQVGTNIVKWAAGGAKMTSTWKSGVTELPAPVNLACAKVRATVYPVTLKYYSDGTLKHTQSVADDSAFWLPSGFLTSLVEIELTVTDGAVTGAWVASSIEELQGV